LTQDISMRSTAPKNFKNTFHVLLGLLACFLSSGPSNSGAATLRTQGQTQTSVDADRMGYLIRVALPIDNNESDRVRNTLKQIAEKSPAVRRQERPVVVLEFDTNNGKTGRGSKFSSCMDLALYLGKPELNRIHTVAYVPSSKVPTASADSKFSAQLNGHAVLVAVAANQLAIAPDVAIGNAGVDDAQVDPNFRDIYRNVAEQSQRLPVPMVMSMLDPQLQLFRVTHSDGGVQYVGAKGLPEALSGETQDTKTIAGQDELTLLSGEELNGFGLISLTPTSRLELSRDLDLAANSLEGNPEDGKDWKALQLDLPDVIDKRSAKWVVDSIKRQIGRDGVNLLILNFDSNIGDVDACLRIASQLAELPEEVRTVAFVRGDARAPVGLIALACKNLIMASDAVVGGTAAFGMADEEVTPDEALTDEALTEDDLATLRPMVKSLATELGKDWSVLMQMVDPGLVVWKYQHKESGQVRLLCDEEFAASSEPELWTPVSQVGGSSGINATTAESNRLARLIADDMGQIQTLFQLDQEPRSMRRSATNRWAEQLAEFLSSPFVAPWLIVLAMFFFSTEMSAPGLGLPGFLAAVCFILFFWSQSLDGNADWLEILMFVVGVIFIAMEIFVLPGFGVFGIGGIVMVIASLVLASQSFIIPRSPQDFVQMAYSLLPVIGAGVGVIVGAVVMRKLIPHSPYLRRMILEPRAPVDTGLGGHDPEAVVDWSHLAGEPGETITRLAPSGKARIAGKVYDVISKGQMVSKGEAIVVVEAIGNRIVVATKDE
jgi:membrane-bound ClpP family serine protease